MKVLLSRVVAVACASLMLLAVPSAAPAADISFQSWNGANPYNCVIQDAGTGTAVPNPDVDPYCVHYDKTGQSVFPSLGIITFLLQEPKRIGIAFNKCFYYQTDHWTGSIVQGDPATQLWNWVGHYYLNFATGAVGAYFQDLSIGPPGRFPSVTFGFQVQGLLPVKPACVAEAQALGSSLYG
jgi:hypothetical protein